MPGLNESIVEDAALSWFGDALPAGGLREAKGPLPPARFSRHFSRQSVVIVGVPNQAMPTVSGYLPGHLPGHFVRVARNLMRPEGKFAVTTDDVFRPPAQISMARSPNSAGSPIKVSASSPYLEMSSGDLEERRDANGCLMTAWPIVDELSLILSSLRTSLEGMNFRNPDMNRDIS